jgi:ATP synthase protein I
MFHAFRARFISGWRLAAGDGIMADEQSGQEPIKAPQDARLDSLEERLEQAQAREAQRTGATTKADANEQLGQRVLSLLIGGLAGGALIGWLFDRLFGTGHLLLVVMMVLGTVGGFWSIFKLVNRRP